MIVRDFIYVTGMMAFVTFVLTMLGQDASLPGGIGVGFYLAGMWVTARYE